MSAEDTPWFMYVVRCADDTLYAGVATDVARRVAEHNGSGRGARYTRARRPVRPVASWRYETRAEACRAEYAFKQLRRDQKLGFVASPDQWG